MGVSTPKNEPLTSSRGILSPSGIQDILKSSVLAESLVETQHPASRLASLGSPAKQEGAECPAPAPLGLSTAPSEALDWATASFSSFRAPAGTGPLRRVKCRLCLPDKEQSGPSGQLSLAGSLASPRPLQGHLQGGTGRDWRSGGWGAALGASTP